MQKFPNANIGIATEASNLIVVDCDSSKGETPPSPWNQAGIKEGVDVFLTAVEDSGNRLTSTPSPSQRQTTGGITTSKHKAYLFVLERM